LKIGENIKEYREKRGLTQKELGNILGISDVMVGQYERGVRVPKHERLEEIARILGTTPTILMGWQNKTTYNEYQEILYFRLKPYSNFQDAFGGFQMECTIEELIFNSQESYEFFISKVLECIDFNYYVDKYYSPKEDIEDTKIALMVRRVMGIKNIIIDEIKNNLANSMYNIYKDIDNFGGFTTKNWLDSNNLYNISKTTYETIFSVFFKLYSIEKMNKYYSKINYTGKEKALEYVKDLSEQIKYSNIEPPPKREIEEYEGYE